MNKSKEVCFELTELALGAENPVLKIRLYHLLSVALGQVSKHFCGL